MNKTLLRLLAFCLAMVLAAASAAQDEPVGSVAGVEGDAEIQHDGTWQPAAVDGPVWPTDVLRTGPQGRLRIVFEASSVLLIANDTEITVDEAAKDHTRLSLSRGKVRAVAEDVFSAPGAVYEIATPIAVATVRGTDFIIVFDPVAAVQMPAADTGRTDVVGIDGRVEVHSTLDPADHGVFVTAYELAIVERGRLPKAPQRLDETMFQQYLEGLEFIGGGRLESAARKSGLAAGDVVPPALGAATVTGSQSGAGPILSHPMAPGEGDVGGSSDDRAPVINQPPRASVLGGGGLDVDF